MRWNVLGDDRACRNDRAVSDHDALQDHCVDPDPDVVSDNYRGVHRRTVDGVEVAVEDVAAPSHRDAAADRDGGGTDDAGVSVEERPIAEGGGSALDLA